MNRRDLVSAVLLVVLLAVLGLLAALTRAPEAPLFQRAASLPLLGSAVSHLRDLYLPPEPLPPSGSAPEVGRFEAKSFVGGTASPERFLRVGLGEVVLLVPGSELRSAPRKDAELLQRLELPLRLTVLEHDGPWVRVPVPGGGSGWVDPRLEPGAPPPLGMDPVPPLPLPGHRPPPERLGEARRLLGAEARDGWLGPYELLTDVSDEVLELHLDRLARGAEARYVARYGLGLEGDAAEIVVLFRDEVDYRQYQSTLPRLSGVAAKGHASLGVVSLFQGSRSRLEVGMTFLHEVGHLLNRRALGPALPPWLDEGLAEDFSHWSVAETGTDPYARFRWQEQGAVRLVGPLASLQMVSDGPAPARLGSVRRLLELDWPDFATGDEAPRHYALAELWIRFLGEGAGGKYRSGWSAYLAGVRVGESAEPEALSGHLGSPWDAVAADFQSWVEAEEELAGLQGGGVQVTSRPPVENR